MNWIPRKYDINVYNSCDEIVAEQNFLGLDVVAATTLIASDPMRYFEDLMWMGPKAFSYYWKAARAYLDGRGQSEWEDLSWFLIAVTFQVQNSATAELLPIPEILKFIDGINRDILDAREVMQLDEALQTLRAAYVGHLINPRSK